MCMRCCPSVAALGYAASSVTAQLFDKSVSTALINLYALAGALTGAVVLVVFTGGYVEVATYQDWLWLLAMGVAGGSAVFCLVTAYRLTAPSNLAPFEYFSIPFAFFLGWMFFDESPFHRLIPRGLPHYRWGAAHCLAPAKGQNGRSSLRLTVLNVVHHSIRAHAAGAA